MALEMTMQCVNNLLEKFSNENILIVIVDNKSPNGSGKELQQYYKDNKLIKVILHDKNDGFARGNNVGFNYLKQNYDIQFMIVMNNDIIIEQNDFLGKIKEIYNSQKFAVLGPDTYAPNINEHQNPMENKIPNSNQCRIWIKNYKKLLRNDNYNYYKLKILHLLYWCIKPIYRFIFSNQNKKEKTNIQGEKTPQKQLQIPTNDYKKESNSCVLFGACLIFDKEYIKKRKYAFYPKTFFYYEENILCLECKKENLKIYYTPKIQVKHLCSVSTNKILKTKREKYRFIWKQHIKSLTEYIKLYEKKDNS